MLNRLKNLSLSAFSLFFCGFFAYDYYQHYKIENNEKIVLGERTGETMQSRRGVETYTIRYRYRVGGREYSGSDNAPKSFLGGYYFSAKPIMVRYEVSNPSNSEIGEPGLAKNHNDITWESGIFMVGSALAGFYFLHTGLPGIFTKIRFWIIHRLRTILSFRFSLSRYRTKGIFRDLRELKNLLDEGCITESDFKAKKKELLNRI